MFDPECENIDYEVKVEEWGVVATNRDNHKTFIHNIPEERQDYSYEGLDILFGEVTKLNTLHIY